MGLCIVGSQATKFQLQSKISVVWLYFECSLSLCQLTSLFRLKLLKVLHKIDLYFRVFIIYIYTSDRELHLNSLLCKLKWNNN